MPYPYFLDIRQAALSKDPSKLTVLLQNGAYIDEQHHGHTPAADLAAEGHIEAAEFLVAQGANPHLVAFAAASMGNLDFALKLHEKYEASKEQIFCGAAMGDIPLNDALTMDEFKQPKLQLAALRGACMKGDVKRIQSWYKKIAPSSHLLTVVELRNIYGNMIIGGALSGVESNRDKWIQELRAALKLKGHSLDDNDPVLLAGFYHAAKTNPATFATTFSKHSPQQKEAIALGALHQKDFAYLNQLLRTFTNAPQEASSLVEKAIQELFATGNYPAVEALISRYRPDLPKGESKHNPLAVNLAKLGIQTGSLTATYWLCQTAGLSPSELELTPQELAHFSAPSSLLGALSHIPDAKFTQGLEKSIAEVLGDAGFFTKLRLSTIDPPAPQDVPSTALRKDK